MLNVLMSTGDLSVIAMAPVHAILKYCVDIIIIEVRGGLIT